MFGKWLLAPLLACVLTPALAAESINVANWNDYIDPEVLKDFTKETGIAVNYRTYDDDQEVYNMLKAGTQLDVVMPSTDNFGRLIRENMLRPVDVGSLPGFAEMDPIVLLRLKPHDPERKYGMPYLWGNVGLAVNVPAVEAALGKPVPRSWSLLFDRDTLDKLQSCGVTLLDSSNDVMGTLAHYQGKSLADASSGEVRHALDYLASLWPKYRYADSERYIEDIRSGAVCVSMAWEGDARSASKANPQVKFILPEEGAEIFMDVVAVPATVRNLDGARAFLQYMLRPDVALKIARFTQYHSPNLKAQKQLKDNGELHEEEAGHTMNKFTYQMPRRDIQQRIEDAWRKLQGQ